MNPAGRDAAFIEQAYWIVLNRPPSAPELDDQRCHHLNSDQVTLSRGLTVVDLGVGANVLDSPALALAHLARLLADQPLSPKAAAGEIVTTGTITDAWPVTAGEVWTSGYGALALKGLTLRFTAQ